MSPIRAFRYILPALALAMCAATPSPSTAQAPPDPSSVVAAPAAPAALPATPRDARLLLTPHQYVAAFGTRVEQARWIDSVTARRDSLDTITCAFTPSTRAELACRRGVLRMRLDSLNARFLDVRRDSAKIPGGWRRADSVRMTDAHRRLVPGERFVMASTAAGLAYNALCPLGARWCDRDAGGYVERLTGPDKVVHAAAATALSAAALEAGMPALHAVAFVTAAGALYEVTQAQAPGGSHASWRDVLWDAGGATVPLVADTALRALPGDHRCRTACRLTLALGAGVIGVRAARAS